MILRKSILVLSVLLLLSTNGCNKKSSVNSGKVDVLSETFGNVLEIAQDAARDVGKVTESHEGIQGPPIIILEEQHDSVAAQIEHAVILCRLQEKHELHNIGLEGYRGRGNGSPIPIFDKGKFTLLGSDTERAEIAVPFLSSGEIGCSEFSALVYNGTNLHAVENPKNITSIGSAASANVAKVYLVRIAEAELTDSQSQIYKKYVDQHNDASAVDYIFSINPWAKSFHVELNGMPRVERELAIVSEIYRTAQSKGIQLAPEEQTAIANRIDFLRKRTAATNDMVQFTSQIAEQPGVKIVALNIGEGHTQALCEALKNMHRPFAVITPNSIRNHDLPINILKQKYKGGPVYPDSPEEKIISSSFGSSVKPPSIILQQKFQAKAELFHITQQISDAMAMAVSNDGGNGPPNITQIIRCLGGGDGGNTGNGDITGSTSSNDGFSFRGAYVWVDFDEKEASIVNKEGHIEVIFRAVINRGSQNAQTIWVKVGRAKGWETKQNENRVETLLLNALKDTKAQGVHKPLVEQTINASERSNGKKTARIQVSLDTKAIISTDKKTAEEAAIRY